MKNLIVVLLATLPFLGLESCSKDGLFSGKDQLPPETTTGANTAGCLVNGEVFIPHQAGFSPSLVCNYEFINGESFFNLYFSDLRGGNIKTVSVRTSKIILTVNNTYLLNIENTIFQPSFMGGGIYGIDASNYYYTNVIKTGELKITRLDLQNSIISGTFWFDAVNAAGETVQIRSGRFDMHY